MRTETLTLYRIDELSEEAQEKAHENFRAKQTERKWNFTKTERFTNHKKTQLC
jgi:hypothetical protein